MTAVADRLAAFVVDLDADTLPEPVVRLVKRQMLDTIGVGIVGSATDTASIAFATASADESSSDCTVWGTGHRAGAATAAYANGIASHALDFDDMWVLGTHPSAPTVPAVLAVAERIGASGRDVLAAQVAAYEVYARICGAVPVRGGWHPTGVFGTLGAAAGAARLLGLDAAQTAAALGLAASHAAGVDGHEGTMSKPFHAGQAAHGGIRAVEMIRAGFSASHGIFDGRYGFFKAFYPDVPLTDWALTTGLGERFFFEYLGIGLKMYPAGYHMHPAFESALEIVIREDLQPDDVAHVRIGVLPNSRFAQTRVDGGLAGKFSMQYMVAMAILDRALTLDSFDDERATSTQVRDMLARVEAVAQSDLPTSRDLRHNPVRIETTDGRIFEAAVTVPRSHWAYRLSDKDWQSKFRDNVGRVPGLVADDILDTVQHLEDVDDVAELCRQLRP